MPAPTGVKWCSWVRPHTQLCLTCLAAIAVPYSCSDGFLCNSRFPELWESSTHLSLFAQTDDFVAVIFPRLAQTSQAVSQTCKYLIKLLCTVWVWIPRCQRQLKIKLCCTFSSWIKSPDRHWFCSLDSNKDLKILNSLTNYALEAGMNKALTWVTIALSCSMRMSLSPGCISHSVCLLSLRRAFRDIKTQCSSEKQSSSCPYFNSSHRSSKKLTHQTQGEGEGQVSLDIWAFSCWKPTVSFCGCFPVVAGNAWTQKKKPPSYRGQNKQGKNHPEISSTKLLFQYKK